MTPKTIKVEGIGDVMLSNLEEYRYLLSDEKVKCLLSDGKRVGGFESLVDGGNYTLGPQLQQIPKYPSSEQGDGRPPLYPNNGVSEGEIRRMVDDAVAVRVARMKLVQPRRDLSLNSKSDAWRLMVHEERVTQGHSFFFALQKLPEGFNTAAFAKQRKRNDPE